MKTWWSTSWRTVCEQVSSGEGGARPVRDGVRRQWKKYFVREKITWKAIVTGSLLD